MAFLSNVLGAASRLLCYQSLNIEAELDAVLRQKFKVSNNEWLVPGPGAIWSLLHPPNFQNTPVSSARQDSELTLWNNSK